MYEYTIELSIKEKLEKCLYVVNYRSLERKSIGQEYCNHYTEGIMGKEAAKLSPVARSYLCVGLLGDMNVLGSVRLTPPLVVPHLSHQLKVSLWFVLFFICIQTNTRYTGGSR